MKKILSTFTLFFCCVLSSFAQEIIDLNIDHMLRGSIYAKSSIEDTLAPGGFGGSYNSARKYTDSLGFNEKGFFLKIDTTRIITVYQKYTGYMLYMVNKTKEVIKLNASDSRLSVIAEVFYKGEWKPIEYLPSSWCGNSYHDVFLKPYEYWSFNVLKFNGEIKAKLRYKLMLDANTFMYSNEITASVNKGQFSVRKDYKPNGIMDPYNE
ncbi:MAG: hypothetical protein ACRCVT_11120 [Leadbetterella sp.]